MLSKPRRAFSALLILTLTCCFGAKAGAWNPGGAVEGWAHVRMGDYEGIYVADDGWRFVGNYPQDLSTAIIAESDVTIPCANGGVLRIPAPKGYWTPTPGTMLEQLCLTWAGQHTQEPLLHMWVRIDPQHGLIVASISKFMPLQNKTVSRADFKELKNKWRDEIIFSNIQKGYLDKYTTIDRGEKVEKLSMHSFGSDSSTHFAFTMRRRHELLPEQMKFESSMSMAYSLLKGQIIGFVARSYDQRNLNDAALECERDLNEWMAIAEKENAQKRLFPWW